MSENRSAKSGKSAKQATQAPASGATRKKPIRPAAKARPKRASTRTKQGGKNTKKLSGLDAAARVLAEAKGPMTCRQIAEVALEKKYWHSGGQTPHATIYSAMIREIAAKGKESRFRKVGRGKFTVRSTKKG